MPRRVSNVFTDLFVSAGGDYLQDYDADWVKVFASYNIMVDAGSGMVYPYNAGGNILYRYDGLAPLGDCMVEWNHYTATFDTVDVFGPALRLQAGDNDGYICWFWNGQREINRIGPSGTYDTLASDTISVTAQTPYNNCEFWVIGSPSVTLRFHVPGFPDLVATDNLPNPLASGYVGLRGYTEQGTLSHRNFIDTYRVWTVAPDSLWRQLPHQLRGRV